MSDRRVVITGIGLITSLGAGIDAHRAALLAPKPVYDADRFPPYVVHPAPEIDWSEQMSRRDQRQMELWQKLGVFAAGLALDSAGLKENAELLSSMDMVIAAAGGERDLEVDTKILNLVHDGADPEQALNETLTTDLRPTLFLAQLSNLLAGNISIVHKVTGSSRTFMGEEASGIAALANVERRIRHGQSTHALVGGSFDGEAADILLSFELDSKLSVNGWQPVANRPAIEPGLMTGSGAAFLVVEDAEHAAARGAVAIAELGPVHQMRLNRDTHFADALAGLFEAAGLEDADLVISGASGTPELVRAEQAALGTSTPVRLFASLTGHLKDPQFLTSVAFAALAVSHDEPVAPFTDDELAAATPAKQALATTVGYVETEGAVLVRRADAGGTS